MFLVQVLLVCSVLTFCAGENITELRLFGIYPFTGQQWPGGWSCYIPVLIAIDDINKRSDVLADYRLAHDHIDSECDPGAAVFKMDQTMGEKNYVLLIGPMLSTVAMSTASVSHHWNITQLAFGATSSVLSNRKRYPNFYRMNASDKNINSARIGLMKKFGWHKVATIHLAVEFFSAMMDAFVEAVTANNITVFTQKVFLKDTLSQVQSLKEDDARIIMAAMYENRAREVLCSAYKVGLYGPKIVWIFPGFYSDVFWKINLDDVECTEEQMIKAMEGSFLFKTADLNIEQRGLANNTYSELMERVRSHENYNPKFSPFDVVSYVCYDTAWTAALTLNCTSTKLQQLGHPKTLDQFNYADVDINNIIEKCLIETSFDGISAQVSFDENGDRLRTVQIERVQNGERQLIGYQRKDTYPQYFVWYDDILHWEGGKVPRDSTYVKKKELLIPTSLYTPLCVCAAIGISIVVFFLTFNIVFRNNRLIKMSSPNINNALLSGCICCYSVVFIKPIEVSSASFCQIRIFCFCLGFTITFGSLFSKTWRVYRIFTNKKLQRVSIKDVQLFAIIGLLSVMMLLVFSAWQIVSPHKVVIRFLTNEVSIIGNDEEVHPYVRVCQSDKSSYFEWTLYIMEGLVLAFGAFLAWETRHVKHEALNDSHQIGLCVYNVLILSAVGLTLSLFLEEQEVMLYGVTSGCLLIGTTLTHLVVFVPKVRCVYKKIDFDDKAVAGTSSSTQPPVSTGLSTRSSFMLKKEPRL